eukprot:3109196-Rhodomonas_salina.1
MDVALRYRILLLGRAKTNRAKQGGTHLHFLGRARSNHRSVCGTTACLDLAGQSILMHLDSVPQRPHPDLAPRACDEKAAVRRAPEAGDCVVAPELIEHIAERRRLPKVLRQRHVEHCHRAIAAAQSQLGPVLRHPDGLDGGLVLPDIRVEAWQHHSAAYQCVVAFWGSRLMVERNLVCLGPG